MIYRKYIFTHIYYLLILTLGLTSCGVYSFSGASIPENAQTISISYIKNQADLIQPSLSNSLTEALINKCLTETNLNLKDQDADISFSGRIVKYNVQPISIQNNETAAQNRLTIKVEITYINNIQESHNFNKTFIDYTDFNSSELFSEIEEELNDIIIKNLVDDIFNAAFINW